MTVSVTRSRVADMTINPFTGKPNDDRPLGNPFLASASPTTAQAASDGPSTAMASAEVTPTIERLTEGQIKDLVTEARDIKVRMDVDKERYAKIKSTLWDGIGRQLGNLPGGASFRKSAANNARRKVDYALLEARFPEAYAATVTVTEPTATADTPGALYL